MAKKQAKKNLFKKIHKKSIIKKSQKSVNTMKLKGQKTSAEPTISSWKSFTTRRVLICSSPRRIWSTMNINRLIKSKWMYKKDKEELKSRWEGKRRRLGKHSGRRNRKSLKNAVLHRRLTGESLRGLASPALCQQHLQAMQEESPDIEQTSSQKHMAKKELRKKNIGIRNTSKIRSRSEISTLLLPTKIDFCSRKGPKRSSGKPSFSKKSKEWKRRCQSWTRNRCSFCSSGRRGWRCRGCKTRCGSRTSTRLTSSSTQRPQGQGLSSLQA